MGILCTPVGAKGKITLEEMAALLEAAGGMRAHPGSVRRLFGPSSTPFEGRSPHSKRRHENPPSEVKVRYGTDQAQNSPRCRIAGPKNGPAFMRMS